MGEAVALTLPTFDDCHLSYRKNLTPYLAEGEIQQERQKYLSATFSEKVFLGVHEGSKRFLSAIALSVVIAPIASNFFDTTNFNNTPSDFSSVQLALVAPIVEEVVFRLILQNVIYLLQKAACMITPERFTKSTVFVWLTSSSCRIIVTTVAFASVHLFNAGLYLSTAFAITQVAIILLIDRHSLLYETTGSIAAPLASHITNNSIIGLICLTGKT